LHGYEFPVPTTPLTENQKEKKKAKKHEKLLALEDMLGATSAAGPSGIAT